jgi:acyl-CoA thioesterase FadM
MPSGAGWVETYRGTVFPWEVDFLDHLTVAYYVERFEHATRAVLAAARVRPDAGGPACVTTDAYIRYLRELRAGDIAHVASGVIATDDAGVLLGHRLVSSETGATCGTAEQRLAAVDPATGAVAPLGPDTRRALDVLRVSWDGPAREARPCPRGSAGFLPTARDTVRPAEVDALGCATLTACVHRFSAAAIQALAAFGMTPGYMRAQRRGLSTFEFQLAVTGRLGAGDVAEVRTALVYVGNSSLHLYHRLRDAGTGAEVATLHQLGVHLDTDARRPTPFPGALRDKALALVAA